jgi:hypothetical protein
MIKFTDAEATKPKEAARKAEEKGAAKPIEGIATPEGAASVAKRSAPPKRKKNDRA